ncbi:SH3 domain-containing protein [bacterium]|nr:SH3 domain-containing protein [bacterium]
MRKTVIIGMLLSLALFSKELLITTGSGGRIREKADTSGKTLVSLPIGDVLELVEKSKTASKIGDMNFHWFKVKTTDGTSGWIYGSMLAPFDEKNGVEIYKKIVKERFSKTRTFEEYGDIVRWLGKLQKKEISNEISCELEYYRLLALKESIDQLIQKGDYNSVNDKHPWIKENSKDLFYHELAGIYILNREEILKTAQKYKDTKSAEKLYWLRANTYLGGECEGYIPCGISSTSFMQGEYVEKYPKGEFSDEAIAKIVETLGQILEYYPESVEAEEKKEIEVTLKELERQTSKYSGKNSESLKNVIAKIRVKNS